MTFRQLEQSSWIQNDPGIYNVSSQIEKYVYKKSDEAYNKGDACRDSITNLLSFEEYRKDMWKKFIEAIGGIPRYNKPLNAKTTGLVKGNGFSIEKVIFESWPGTYITSMH